MSDRIIWLMTESGTAHNGWEDRGITPDFTSCGIQFSATRDAFKSDKLCKRCLRNTDPHWLPSCSDERVHLCVYASQPDIQIKCDKSWTTPAWKRTLRLTKDTYESDDTRIYTFEPTLVTCEDCKGK